MKGDDKDAIESKMSALESKSREIAQKAAAQQAEQGQQRSEGAEASGKQEEDVVDAEYEEVDENKDK